MSIHPPTPLPSSPSQSCGAGSGQRPSIGEVVHARRGALRMTLQQLAEAAGCARSYVWAIEHERRDHPPSDEVLTRIERALGLEAGRLIQAARWQATPRDVRREVTRLRSRECVVERLVELLRGSETARQRDSETGGEREAKSEQGARWGGLDAAYRSGELRRLIDRISPEGAGGAEALPLAAGLPREVPLINKVAAGYPREFTDLGYPARVADEYVRCPDLDDPDAFAARVVGDSMLPDYREGDIVVFSPARPVASGMDCFIRTEPDHESTFKRVYFEGEETERRRDGETERQRDSETARQGGAIGGGDTGGAGGERIRLQPLNPAYPARVLEREQVAGLYAAVSVMRKIG
ncbi:MAG: helix-turn-helix domain-containing protein [Phycisphaerales bacterium]